MKDPFFEGTVILLCQYDAEGALGLVLNRECPISVGEVLEQTKLPSIKDGTKKTLWGGPVGGGACFVLWKGTPPADQGWIINAEVAVSPSLERLKVLIEDNVNFDIIVGYAGWGAGQLENEIKMGSWLYSDEMDTDMIFHSPLDQRYDKAIETLGLTRTHVWMKPIDE